MSADPKSWKVGLVGYGEVGRILCEDLRKAGVAVAAYDIKLDDDRAWPLRNSVSVFHRGCGHDGVAARSGCFGAGRRRHRRRPRECATGCAAAAGVGPLVLNCPKTRRAGPEGRELPGHVFRAAHGRARVKGGAFLGSRASAVTVAPAERTLYAGSDVCD